MLLDLNWAILKFWCIENEFEIKHFIFFNAPWEQSQCTKLCYVGLIDI